MKKKAIIDITSGDNPLLCEQGCRCLFRPVPRGDVIRERHGVEKIVTFRSDACLAATKLAERIINELNRLRDVAGETLNEFPE